jgi:metal-responsive CopG/Arc/MetJ family transcriptional regulator
VILGGFIVGYEKISVTIPEEILKEIKKLAEKRETKLSHFISDVLADKVRRSKEQSFVQRINEIFADPEVAEEQRLMAKDIADSTDVEELPW